MGSGSNWGIYASSLVSGLTGSIIKTVTPISISIASGSTSGTQTVSISNTSNTFIIWNGTSAASSAGDSDFFASITITNSTTVTATRNTSSTAACVVKATLVEFVSGVVNSIQQGVVNLAASGGTGTSNTATLGTTVNTSTSVLFYNGFNTSSTSQAGISTASGITLTNSTTVTANRNSANGTQAISFVVVDFSSSVVKTVQSRVFVTTTTSTTLTDTLPTAVVVSNSMIAYCGEMTGTSTFSNFKHTLQLTGTTTVSLTRATASATSRTIYYTVVEFQSGILNSAVQRNTTALSAATSTTDTITSINTAKSIITYTGFQSTATVLAQMYTDVALTNATTLTFAKNTSTGASTTGWEAVEFI